MQIIDVVDSFGGDVVKVGSFLVNVDTCPNSWRRLTSTKFSSAQFLGEHHAKYLPWLSKSCL
jgi:hypothetical protein